ncbi:MAG TPA: response regulator transcription factor [Burkholderiaceae bacterium]|nr:response regulator transcription factor [Burkholderiaceae bacterium]
MGMRFLVVDDHPLMRGAVRTCLETLGEAVQVEQAATLADALRCLERGLRTDVALLDLNLPDTTAMSGLETLRRRHPRLPVLAISGQHDRATVERCLKAGANGFLPKTAHPERLAAAVRCVAGGGIHVPPDDAPTAARLPAPAPRETVDARSLGLTERQWEVLMLILEGLPNKLIGRRLDLAEGTVKVHVSAVLRALGARNRTQAVLAANRLGIRLPD